MADGITHYRFTVRLGPGEFDVVRLHRVVREHRRFRPKRTDGAVFMLHGASLSFEAIYLYAGSDVVDPQTSVAAYLAANGIDVWGMDYAWTLVPEETTDLSFMRDWGVERDAGHALAAMSIARLLRGLTGQGLGTIHLLGYSYGTAVTYAAAGRETQMPSMLRDIRGVIPVDAAMKFGPVNEAGRLAACAEAAAMQDRLQNGTFHTAQGRNLRTFSNLATIAPDDPSPIIPGLSNYQAALFIGTNSFDLNPPLAPFWHFVAGDLNDVGIPVDLLYSSPARWIRLLGSLPPYMPERARLDLRSSLCDEENVSIDDHLEQISVPILYLGAEGAIGSTGHHTSSLTASRDITHHTVRLQPVDQRAFDYGHADLFLGRESPTLVWDVLRDWLEVHSGKKHHAHRWR